MNYLKPYLFSVYFSILFLTGCGSDDGTRILIGTSNKLFDYSVQHYQAPFTVHITDSNGVAVPNQKVTISAIPLTYVKGEYRKVDTDGDAEEDSWAIDDPNTPANESLACANEDANHNGVLDAGEDINSSGQLEPTNTTTVGAHPENIPTITGQGEIITDADGIGYFSLIYPKSEALWSTVRITGRAKVTGTESAETLDYYLLALITDLQSIDTAPPGGITSSPYGITLNCTDPN